MHYEYVGGCGFNPPQQHFISLFFRWKKEMKLLLTPERPCVEIDEGRNKTCSSTCLNATFLDRKEVLHTAMLH